MKTFKEKLGNEWLFFDGAMGTMLQAKGLMVGEVPETWNLTHPDDIIDIHLQYINAGANIITTNTFGANRLKINNVDEVITTSINLAKEARSRSHREDVYIALDLGPTGKLLEPMGDLPFEEAVSIFREMVLAGTKAGADLILIETMSDSYEAKAAILAAKENCDLPVCITFIFDETGHLLSGGIPESVIPMCEGLGVDAIGINCGLGPKQMLPLAKKIVELASIPVIVNPNAGLPREENGIVTYDLDPDEFVYWIKQIALCNVQGLGGCCGTNPAYISKMIKEVISMPFRPIVPKKRTWVTSYSKAVEIASRPVIIGERINPTGKSKLKEALRNQDFDYLLSQALEQEEAGAHVLDVNVGLPEINEPEMMKQTIFHLQSVTSLPLQIDTSNIEALEQGLRIYNGKPMINSVNGKVESMEAIFPLVKKYGAVIVGLCLDESGIPSTAKERVEIAKKIYSTAKEYGIDPKEIVIDGLAMTISSQSDSAIVALDTIKDIHDKYQGHTILGVSNISFGLPQREIINSHFLTMAFYQGLSCAIINPNNKSMMDSYHAYEALTMKDPQCQRYIQTYGGQSVIAPTQESTMTLSYAIQAGLKKQASKLTEELLGDKDALKIIDEELIPALDIVGQGYEKGKIFLPQLLMSAEAAKQSFAVLKDKMPQSDESSKGKIILATVQGDIHDIGKNIVKVLLENYGYDVIDLGKDVPPETIVQKALQENIALVGLSALMTTTVTNMEKTINMLHEKKPDAHIVVGGAVLNKEYAKKIHADYYAKDAMATVRYADKIFSQGEENQI